MKKQTRGVVYDVGIGIKKSGMKFLRGLILLVVGLVLICNEANAQRLDIKGVRKKSKATDVATIVFKSDFDSLTVIGTSEDSIYKKKDCDYNHVWTQYVDLRHEREQGSPSPINRSFVLHTPYTEDVNLTIPGNGKELQQGIYEYNVRMFDYFPLRVTCEIDVVRMRDYFGLRISAGKRLGGYLALKLTRHIKEGFNADERGEGVDLSKKTYEGRIRNSYMAGFKYGIASRDYPVFLYMGAGYGNDGVQRSNGKKIGQGRVTYYNDYTSGFESELGASLILFDFFSISMGADAVFGHRVAFDINCTLGFVIDFSK